MIKYFFAAIGVFILSIPVFSQSEKLDEGFGPLHIDVKLSKIKSYLTAIDVEQWSTDAQEMEGYITSGWVFDYKKANLLTYHGLTISGIEVYSDTGESEETTADDNVYSFQIYLQKPVNDEAKEKLTDALFGLYGDTQFLQNEDSREVVGLFWFSSITLLTVLFGEDPETGEKFDYYLADFQQGYGG
jgi:hypothetical protein